MNEGACIGDSLHPDCGPGIQIQVRTCTDGSNASRFPVERCTEEEKIRTVSCAVAGTELPSCITDGILSEITYYLILIYIKNTKLSKPKFQMITLLRLDTCEDCNCNGNCAQGEGDCDDDKDCLPGLVCEFDGWWGTDFCKAGMIF